MDDGGRGGRKRFGLALHLAAVVLGGLALAQEARAICCVCQGASGTDFCQARSDVSCGIGTVTCTAYCASLGGTVRQCCDSEDCSNGGADSCAAGQSTCAQTASGAGGFCDGTCAGIAPSPTPTDTPAPTPINPAPATSRTGLIVAVLLLAGVALFASRRLQT